jgi:ABC-type transporter Mla subunit MlaD
LFTLRLNELSILSEEFKIEINRLIKTDFYKLFEDLQTIFIEKSRKDLAIELDRLEEKSKNIQIKIDYLDQIIKRLEAIDLEKHFDKLQKTLSEIFGAINTINLTLTNIVQTLPGIFQSLATLQTTIDTNHNQIRQLLKGYNQGIEGHLTEQDIQATKKFELLELKINSVLDQNNLIRKEVKISRIIQIIGLTVIILILLYVAINV